MRLISGFVLSVATMPLAACGERQQSNDAISVAGNSAGTSSAPARIAPAEARGQDFVATVLGTLRFEIDSARMAAGKAQRADVKALGSTMVSAFEASERELTALAKADGLKTEPLAGATHQSDLAILSSTQGAPLELAFLEQQSLSLMELLGLVRAYKNGGDDADLKGWAERTQTVIADRLNDVQTLRAVILEARETNAGS